MRLRHCRCCARIVTVRRPLLSDTSNDDQMAQDKRPRQSRLLANHQCGMPGEERATDGEEPSTIYFKESSGESQAPIPHRTRTHANRGHESAAGRSGPSFDPVSDSELSQPGTT
jgi:hypothetical protein